MQDWKSVPKIDLHCHLDGSLSPAFVRERLESAISDSALQVSDDCSNLTEYLEKFSLPLACMQDEAGLRGAGYDIIRSAAEENVRYIEVRFAPQLCTQQGLSVERVIEAVLQGLEAGQREFQVESQVIVCAMRHLSDEANLDMLRQARNFLGQGVCAVDLAGDESQYPAQMFQTLFMDVKRLGFPFVMHAGECGSVQNVRDAIGYGARRIGHGIAMQDAPALLQLCREREIGVELCPHSNLQTRAVKNLGDYPIGKFLRAGVPVTVNTDNRTVSGCTVTDELIFVQQHCGVTDAQIYTMLRNAVTVSFAEDHIKQRLLRYIVEGEHKCQTTHVSF